MRFPGYEGEWQLKRLGDLLEFKNGINATREQYGSGYKFINVLDILNNDYLTHEKIVGKVNVDQATADKYPVNYGDILFQRSSETREEVGTANVYLDKEYTATFGGFVIRGRKISDYNPIFLNKVLQTNSVRNSITSRSGGSTRYNVGQEILSSTVAPLPSILEQDKIAAFLSLIDTRIATQSKIIGELETSMQNLRKNILSQKFRFKDNSGNSFTDWEAKKLADISARKSSNISANKIENNLGNYIIYGASGVLKKVDFYEEKDDYISIVKDGAGVGRLFYCEGKSSVLSTMDIIKPNVGINTYFLFCLLSHVDFSKYVSGSTIPHIYFKDYKKENCNIPSLVEQKRIADLLLSICRKIAIENQLLLKYENQKQYLLKKMFI